MSTKASTQRPRRARRKLTQLGEARTGLTFEQLPGASSSASPTLADLRSAPGGIRRGRTRPQHSRNHKHSEHVVALPPECDSHALCDEQSGLLLAAAAALHGNSLRDLAIVRSSIAGG
jgi:hypothetical protein